MADVTALNTYNDSGTIKARKFSSQDELLEWIQQQVMAGALKEKNVYWKGYVPNLLGANAIHQFYIDVFGSLDNVLLKNFFLQKLFIRDSVPAGYETPDIYVEVFYNMWYYLDNTTWMLVYRV